jgi:hypothetical protein
LIDSVEFSLSCIAEPRSVKVVRLLIIRSDRSSGIYIIMCGITVEFLIELIVKYIIFSLFLLYILFFFVVLQPSFVLLNYL